MSEKTLLSHQPAQMRGQRSSRSRWTTGLRAASALTAAAFVCYNLSGVPVPSGLRASSKNSDVCLTPACVHTASEILYNLSPSYQKLDPCNDFEELVCGGWRERNDLRPDQGSAFTGTFMAERGQKLLRHILEAPFEKEFKMASSDDEDNFHKMRAAYKACLDEDTVIKAGIEPLLGVLDEIKEKFPTKTIESTDARFKNVLQLLNSLGVEPLISTGVGPDDRDPDSAVVAVQAPWRFGLPSKERYEDDKLVENYRDVLVKVLGSIYPEANKDAFKSVVDLEKKLAAASPSEEDRNDVTKYYNPMSLDDASALAPEIGLGAIVRELAKGNSQAERVIVASPSYLSTLSKILSETNDEVLQSYFIWKVVQSLHFEIESTELVPLERFSNELAGKDPDAVPERWRRCVAHVDDGVPWILSRFFVEKAFSPEAKKFGDAIVTQIKDEFVTKLKNVEWMDDETTKKAINKVHNIIQKIGYPTKSPDVMDPKDLHKYYKKLSLSPDSLFNNTLSIRKFQIDEEWSAVGKPVDKNTWGMSVPTVNAYYNPPGNEIVFPAGIMQFPVFDVDAPAYLSYGAFGSVAGHELSHAFDSTGRHYDETGNYTDWWSNDTVQEFKKRAECFVDQYAKFSVEGPDDKPLHVNGRLTLGENIADAGGLSAGFQAWKHRTSDHPDKGLPGLDFFTQEQLFFVSYSNWWCGKSTKANAINRIYTDPHSPTWARVLGTMANSREFRESFQCKQKEPTCELW